MKRRISQAEAMRSICTPCARHPDATLQSGWRVCRARPGVRSFCHGLVLLLQAGFEARYQTLRRFAPVGAEEVDGDDRIELLAQPRRLAGDLGQRVVGQVVAEAARHLARLGRDAPVVLVARRIEQRLQLAIGQPSTRAASQTIASPPLSTISLASQAKSSRGLGIGRQRVDGALHRDRAQRLQPSPDLHPRIGGLGRQLMDQQQPARALKVSLVVIVHPYHTTYRYCNICIFFSCIPLIHSYIAHETSVSKERNRCLSAPILSHNNAFRLVAPPARARRFRVWPALVATVVVWRQRRRTRQHLATLDDRALADVGLSRAQQRSECAKSSWEF